MESNSILPKYLLQLADNNLILGQRLGEWCGHGPVLEQDIALTNIALDLLGQARLLFQYAAELMGGDTTEDTLAYLRKENEYLNCLITEQQNGDFGKTIMRQFFFDAFNYYNFKELTRSPDDHLAAIAEKSIKEVSYHLRFSSEWVVRLGDGTEESTTRMQRALDELWPYTAELYTPSKIDKTLHEKGITPDLTKVETLWKEKIDDILQEATLTKPDIPFFQTGGKEGRHTENMGFILTELQYMQRTYPNLQW